MLIIDKDNNKEISSVLLMLSPSEAKELSDKLRSLNVDQGDHGHVDNDAYNREITFSIYTQENLHFFSAEIRNRLSNSST